MLCLFCLVRMLFGYKHLGLPSPFDLPPHDPLILPPGPMRTHLSLNHFLGFSSDSSSIKFGQLTFHNPSMCSLLTQF